MTNGSSMRSFFWVHPRFEEIVKINRLDQYDALWGATQQLSLSKEKLADWRMRSVLTLKTTEGEKKFYLKRYNRPPLKQQLINRLGSFSCTAHREYYWLERLHQYGITCPVPVVFGYQYRGWREQQSLLLTAEVAGQSLEQWLPQQINNHQFDRAQKQKLLAQSAEFIRRFQGHGLIHRDLYLSHLFVESGSHSDYRFSLIDLQRVFKAKWRKYRWQIKDLAALNYSAPPIITSADRLRWLKGLLQTSNMKSPAVRRLIRDIRRKTERIARHSRKHQLG